VAGGAWSARFPALAPRERRSEPPYSIDRYGRRGPGGEDQPEPTPTVDTGTADDLSRFGRFIGPSALPGDRDARQCSAEALQAPGDVLANLDSVPADVTYRAVSEIRATLGRTGITDRRRRMRVAVRV
jgi:hypothetical protein